jgi:hypothetical protein
MIYTSYEMIRDCRANVATGWGYFLRQYVPVVRRILEHYAGTAEALESVLSSVAKPDSVLFQRLDPVPERPFVAELRQSVLAALPLADAGLPLDLEQVAAALEPFTIVEKQVAWLEGMNYSAPATGEMLRMSAATVEKIRSRAAERIRTHVDGWNADLLAKNGFALGREAASAGGKDCLPAKTFLDVIDGRATWRGREEMERHILGCWHCIDHFCRLHEVVELLRGIQPLTEEEAAPFDRLSGIVAEKRAGWRRLFGG